MFFYASSFFCCLDRSFSGAGCSLKSAVQQMFVRRAAEFRLPCSKSSSAARQKLFCKAADFCEQTAE